MAVKILVFSRNCGRYQVGRDPIKRLIGASARVRVDELIEHIPIPIQDTRGFELRSVRAQIPHAGKRFRNGIILVQRDRTADQH